jgi:glycosyltransferase involved in cell wall biosynthesis
MEKNSDSPTVSIVTPSYNQGQFIEKTILSVLGQDYSNLQYIIFDGASSDNTPQILRRYSSYIDLVVSKKDNGQSDALNRGFQQCSGEIFAYLNSDDCYANKRVVSTVVKYFQAHPEIDVIYGQRYYIDEKGYFHFCYPTRPFSKESLYLSCYIHQECAFWRRSIYEKAGGFIDDSFRFAMDYELWLRFLKSGAEILAVNDLFGLFRSYDNQKSIAQWQQFGLPEIERVYRQYCDRALPEDEMINAYQEHFYGVNPGENFELYRLAFDLWNSVVTFKRNTLTLPIDTWGLRADLSQRKKSNHLRY